MTLGWITALLLAAPLAAAAERAAMEKPRLECVSYDRYTRITAPKTLGAASARLEFRAAGDGGAWYSIGMATEGSLWTAVLPRPMRPLAGLEYRITTRSSMAGEESAPPVALRVADPAGCPGDERSLAAVDAPIVVRVPRGAPLVPPVPAGFSPAGVVAAEDRASVSALKAVAIGAGVAGGITAAAFGGDALSKPPPVDLLLPGFAVTHTSPAPGTTLSVSRDRLSVFLLLTGRTTIPFNFNWSFELMGAGGETCLVIRGRATISTALPATVTLTGPFNRVASCADRFAVDRSRLQVWVATRLVFEAVQSPLPFQFEP